MQILFVYGQDESQNIKILGNNSQQFNHALFWQYFNAYTEWDLQANTVYADSELYVESFPPFYTPVDLEASSEAWIYCTYGEVTSPEESAPYETWDNFFQQLLFGEGAFIGFIILSAIMMLITLKEKLMGFPFIICSLFLSIYCFANIPVSSNFMWVGVLYTSLCLLITVILVKDVY